MYLRLEDLPYVLPVIGLYFLLGGLCYWGALEWESWFLFAMGTIWMFMGLASTLYFMFVPPREDV